MKFQYFDVLGRPVPLGEEEFFLLKKSFEEPPQDAWGLKAAAAAREEEAATAAYAEERDQWVQIESRARLERKAREARRQRAAFYREVPTGVTLKIGGGGLAALELRSNMDEVREEQQLLRNEQARKIWAARMAESAARPATIKIAGVHCPPVRGTWKVYIRRQGESARQHTKRVKGMVWAMREARQQAIEKRLQDLTLMQQLQRSIWLLRRSGYQDVNPFVLLGEEKLSSPTKAELATACLRKPAVEKKDKVVKRKFYNAFEAKRLARKLNLALYQAEWREFRAYRRDRMSRVLIKLGNHRVESAVAALTRLCTPQIKKVYAEMQQRYQGAGSLRPEDVQGEMEAEAADAHGDTSVNVDQRSTVVLQHAAGDEVSSALPSTTGNVYEKLSAPANEISTSQFGDRPFTLQNFEWSSDRASNTNLMSLDIFKDILTNKAFKDSPNYMLFSRHAYFKSDLEFTITCNSNVRQYGQLQIVFYYGANQDVNYLNRKNIYSSSQRLHSLLTANFSNNVILKVPMEYIFPLFPLANLNKDWSMCHLGRLDINVVVPLTVINSVASKCSCSVLVAFKNLELQGMVGSKIVGQMFPMMSVIAASSILDRNRDRPSVISAGNVVIPINASSWCAGRGQPDYTNVLRLDPTTVLEYGSGRIPNVDEMTIDYVKRIFGLIDMIAWKDDHGDKTLLAAYDAEPLFELSDYHMRPVVVGNQVNYVVPPVGVLTSLFAYWRGTLEFRFDVVGCTEITGRLLVCFVPRRDKNDRVVTYDEALGCPHAIFDMKENRQFVFTVPFICDRMFWPRKYSITGDVQNSFGCIKIFVYNSLISNTTIPDNCKILVYIRGGDDFEVAVPIHPCLAAGFDSRFFTSDKTVKKIIIKEGYFPVYSGQWRYSYVDQNLISSQFSSLMKLLTTKTLVGWPSYVPILRYGPVSDHIAQCRAVNFSIKENTPVIANNPNLGDNKFQISFRSNELKSNESYNFRNFIVYLDGGYLYVSPLISEVHKSAIVRLKSSMISPDMVRICWLVSFAYAENITWDKMKTNGTIYPIASDYIEPASFVLIPMNLTIEGEGDDRDSIAAIPMEPQSSAKQSAASLVFGEQFLDLKDYCRRYHLYATGVYDVKEAEGTRYWRTISLRFPVLPQGLELDLGNDHEIKEYWNRAREGPIPLIASGYRFFTGGIRFRVCINVRSNSVSGYDPSGKIFVQHRPNVWHKERKVVVTSTSSLGNQDIELPGFASYHQFDNLNNVLSIEIPFYQASIRNYLQIADSSQNSFVHQFSTLGDLVVGLTVYDYSNFKISYDVYYCLADDARFSVFVGFPPMINISTFADVEPPSNLAIIEEEESPESDDESEAASVVTSGSSFADLEIQGEMGLTDKVTSLFSAAKTVGEVDASVVNEAASKTVEMCDMMKSGFTSFLPSFESVEMKMHKYVDLAINAITNIFHLFMNFNLKTLFVALGSFFCQLKLLSFKFVAPFISAITNFFQKCDSVDAESVSDSIQQTAEAVIQGEMAEPEAKTKEESDKNDSLICSVASTLIAGVAGLFSVTAEFTKERTKSIAAIIFNGLGKFAFTANHLFTFVKNNLIAIKQIAEWIFGDHPSIRKLGFLKAEDESIYKWAEKVVEITDPRKEHMAFQNAVTASKVYVLAQQASILQIKLLDLTLSANQTSVINLLVKKIHDLRDRLAKAHMAPPIRFEPFVIELTGGSGIGKSELLKTLPYEIFKFMNFKHNGPLIYHRNLGNEFWNNLHNEPVCTYDEKFPIKTQEAMGAQLAEIIQLKSSCVFNPPMAGVPEKDIRYNPIIVQFASNEPFPAINEARCAMAIDRRRDILIQVSMNDAMKAKYGKDCQFKHLSSREAGKYGEFKYLSFSICKDPEKRDLGLDNWNHPVVYSEMIKQLCEAFRTFYIREEKKYRREIARLSELMPENIDEKGSFAEFCDFDWINTFQNRKITANDEEALKVIEEKRKIYEECKEDSYEVKKIRYKYFFHQMFNSSPEKIKAVQRELDEALMAKGILKMCRDEIAASQAQLAEQRRKNAHPGIQYLINKRRADEKKMSENEIAQEVAAIDEVHQGAISKEIPVSNNKPLTKKNLEILNKNLTLPRINNNMPKRPPGPIVAEARVDLEKFYEGCIHRRLAWFLESNPRKVEYVDSAKRMETEINDEFLDEFLMFHESGKFSGREALKYYFSEHIEDETFFFDFKGCQNTDCPFKDPNECFEIIRDSYVRSKPDLRKKLMDGENIRGFLPDFYVDRILHANRQRGCKVEEHKKAEESLPEVKSLFTRFKEKFYDIKWVKYLRKLGFVLGIFSAVGIMIGLGSHFLKGTPCNLTSNVSALAAGAKLATIQDADEQTTSIVTKITEAIGQGHASGDFKTARQFAASSKPLIRALARGEMEIHNQSSLTRAIRRNCFWLSMNSDRYKSALMGRCLGVANHSAICVDHIYEAFLKEYQFSGKDSITVIVARDGSPSAVEIPFTLIKYTKFENSSLGIVKLPRSIPSFKDIRSLVATQGQHKNLNLQGKIFKLDLNFLSTVDLTEIELKFNTFKNFQVGGNQTWDAFTVHDGYEYHGFSGAGNCGSVLCASGTNSPIIGIHVAGVKNQSWGFSESLCREQLQDLFGPSAADIAGEGLLSQYFVDAEVIGVGKVASRYAHRERGVSRIVPSICQQSGEFEVYTDVSVQDKKDPRLPEPFSPMLEGCKFHGKPLIPFNEQDLELAVQDYEQVVLAKCVPMREPSLLTVDEAIGGFDGKPGYEHLEFNTSEGFPFVGMRPSTASNKKWLFEFDENNKYKSTHPILLSELEKKWDQRLRNIIPSTVFTDCLKDCTIDKNKVLQPGKTRIFSMSPVDFTIQQRQCTLDFVVSFMASRRNLEHMIGCNPDSFEWTHLARDLLKNGTAIATGDYSKFGDTIPPEFIHAAFRIIRNWYIHNGCKDAELLQQLEIMPYEIANSIHLMFNHLYQCVCGQPSGNSLTVIINSIAGALYLRTAWLEIMRNTPFASLADYHKHVKAFTYGDDLIVSLSDTIKDQFNCIHWHSFFGAHKLKFTNADKGETIVGYGSIMEADFLKRGFRDHPYRQLPQVVLAPLKQESVEDTVNWVWSDSYGRAEEGSPTFEQMCMQVCGDSSRNAFGRGPKYYEQWRQKLIMFWVKRGHVLNLETWEQLDYKIFNLGHDLFKFYKKIFVPSYYNSDQFLEIK